MRRVRVIALAALAACAACANEDAGRPAGARTPLVLTTVADSPPLPPSTTTRLIEVRGAVPEGWTVRAGSQAIVPRPGDASGTMLELEGGRSTRIDIAGEFDPSTFNQVAVSVHNRLKADLAVEAWRAGKLVLASRTVRFSRHELLGTIVLDLPGMLAESEPFDRLRLRIPYTGGSPVAIAAVALVLRPVAGLLPPPDAPGPVTIGEETRSGMRLAGVQPLRASLVPQRGERLEFSIGRPAAVHRPGEEVAVRLSLWTRKGAPWRQRFPLVSAGSEVPWRMEVVDLSPFAGEELSVVFELESAGFDDPACVLGPPYITRPGPDRIVLFVTSDTHRADHLGAMGFDISTPFLDQVAAQGVLFRDCWSATNITNPSHIAMMTALSPRDTGVVDNITAISEAAPTLAEAFRAAGFTTLAAVSASHVSPEQSGLFQGFDRMDTPDTTNRDAAETIARLEPWLLELRDRPLFVWLHLFDAHGPYDSPPQFLRLYWEAHRNPRDPNLPLPPENERAVWAMDVRDPEYILAQYKGEVSYLDDQLARFLADRRLADALLAITGDHGESLGNHGVYWEHKELYPDTLAVPLVLRGPGVQAGLVVDEPVTNTDLGRTLLDLAGLARTEFPGRNLLRDRKGAAPPRFALSSHGQSASIQSGAWFLVLHLRRHKRHSDDSLYELHELELYDLDDDPLCQTDLAAENGAKTAALRAELMAWLASGGERLTVARDVQDADAIRDLAALGYGGGESVEDPDAAWIDPTCTCEHCAPYLETR